MPRPQAKRSKAQKSHIAGVNARHSGQTTPAEALSLVSNPDSPLDLSEKVKAMETALNAANQALAQREAELQAAEEKNHSLYKTIRVERRKGQRASVRKQILEGQIKFLQSVELPTAKGDAVRAIQLLGKTRADNDHLKNELSRLLERCTLEASQSKAKRMELETKVAASKSQNKNLQKRCNRVPEIKAKAVKRAKDSANKENKTYKLLHKGAYSPQARELARMLVLAGCSRGYVSNVIHAVCKSAGVAVKGSMSRRTVSRAILEGGIAAKIQIGHELAQAEGK
jgi:hypothetical protein